MAADLAKRNWEVAMVERSDKMYGGSCINIGCIPTKTLVHDAQLAANRSNLSFEEKREYYRQAILRKDEVTSFLREKNYKNLADLENVTVYTGEGSFIDSDTVRVHTEEEDILLQSAHIFINTGAETVIPPLEGIQENIYKLALERRSKLITKVDSYEEFKTLLDTKGGFFLCHWDGTPETEELIKNETKATIRCIPFDAPDEEGKCMVTGKPSHKRVLIARAY